MILLRKHNPSVFSLEEVKFHFLHFIFACLDDSVLRIAQLTIIASRVLYFADLLLPGLRLSFRIRAIIFWICDNQFTKRKFSNLLIE